MRKLSKINAAIQPNIVRNAPSYARRRVNMVQDTFTSIVMVKHSETETELLVSDDDDAVGAVWIPKSPVLLDPKDRGKFIVVTLTHTDARRFGFAVPVLFDFDRYVPMNARCCGMPSRPRSASVCGSPDRCSRTSAGRRGRVEGTSMPDSCQQLRRMLITHSTMSLATGTITPGSQEWVTRACGSPLFDSRSKAIGKCPSCEGGWTHPHSYPVDAEVATS
jgi:hypothetical protein